MPVTCSLCEEKRATLKRPKTGDALCKECFFYAFEEEVHKTIIDGKLFKKGIHRKINFLIIAGEQKDKLKKFGANTHYFLIVGEVVAVGASGGKDSTVLAYVLKLLNDKYDYGLKLILLSVDEGRCLGLHLNEFLTK